MSSANKGFGNQDHKFQQRAFKALPLLVRQAKAGQPIFYSDLAPELEMTNPRNLNNVLGAIGEELEALSIQWGEVVPPIQCMVINKTDGTPGEAIDYFMDIREFRKKTPTERRRIVQQKIIEISSYKRWDEVLKHFGMTAVVLIDNETLEREAAEISSRYGNGAGEGPEHEALKLYISKHPELFGLPVDCLVRVEYAFESCDTIDVLFQNNKEWVGVEVKGPISDESDLIRGMFQCAKYLALMEATQKVLQMDLNSRVILAIGREFPDALNSRKLALGTEVTQVTTDEAN